MRRSGIDAAGGPPLGRRGDLRVDREFEPELRASEADELSRRWGEAVERSLDRA